MRWSDWEYAECFKEGTQKRGKRRASNKKKTFPLMWNWCDRLTLKMEMRQKNVEKVEIISPHRLRPSLPVSPRGLWSPTSQCPPQGSSLPFPLSPPPPPPPRFLSSVWWWGGQQASSLSETPRTEIYFLVTISMSVVPQIFNSFLGFPGFLDGLMVFWRSPVGQKVSWHLRNAAKVLGVSEQNLRYQVSAKRSWGRF